MMARWSIVVAVVVALILTIVGGSQRAQAVEGCNRPAGTKITFQRGAIPVVLVHGWNGSPKGMSPISDYLKEKFGSRVAVFSFDYSDHARLWAARAPVASCLAEYVRRVSDTFAQRVTVVTHSMGGLAIRFASDPRFAAKPVTAAHLVRVVTIDTPHLGSPLGGTPAADAIGVVAEVARLRLFPAQATDAARCLAVFDADHPLPENCPYAPYLPKGVALTQIGGENMQKRTLFGVELYKYSLFSDGIVGSTSMAGYPGSAGKAPTGYKLAYRQVTCATTSDQGLKALATYAVSRNVLAVYTRFLGGLYADIAVMDALKAGKPGAAAMAAWLAALLSSRCSHTAIVKNGATLRAVAEEVTQSLAIGPAAEAASSKAEVGAMPRGFTMPDVVDEAPVLASWDPCGDHKADRDMISLRRASRMRVQWGEEAGASQAVMLLVSRQAAERLLASIRKGGCVGKKSDYEPGVRSRFRTWDVPGVGDEAFMISSEYYRPDGGEAPTPMGFLKLYVRRGDIVVLASGGNWYREMPTPSLGDSDYARAVESIQAILKQL